MATISGGDGLAKALGKIAANTSKASRVDVGFMGGATYPDGTLVSFVAATQEFGAPSRGIPPRPFFRTMIAAKSPEWPDAIAGVLKSSDFDAAKALDVVGDQIAEQLKQSIIDTNSPALSPVTVMLRGMRTQAKYQGKRFGELIAEARARVAAGKTNYGASTKPLEDTDQMLHSVTHAVS